MRRLMAAMRLHGEEKFEKDVYDVDHITFLGDWKIIFQTLKTVIKREGISSGSSVTMEEFKGSKTIETGCSERSCI